ncbi:major facilitator superfamily domain-containing protein [Ilyonectria robusta]|uniref:major facilitator superfamily domain-containing protein n=1 Tax=Ilyonectria robusta TaxID=1079257 RepID=UPI001E8EB352|nr:major facilitator superfamily domain-containing protein [Ilyonectria robusta]KAH8670663.1 major facilitator superfamily domain-containing protein [Ilyonectria robusta]
MAMLTKDHQELSGGDDPRTIASVELGEKKSPDFGEPPDGGLQAWTVAAGAAFISFSAMGFANSFGIFQQYYMTHQLQGESADKVAWIGSLAAFLQFAAGAVGGPLFDRYGEWVIRPAAVLYIFSIMMISICREYWHFMLAQGVLMGTAMGLLTFPSIAAVSQYFEKKRAAALGVAISGSSIGGVVIPITLSKLLTTSSLGFGWTVRVVGFIMLPLLAFSCVTVKARLPPRPTTFFTVEAFKQVNFVLLIISLFFLFLGMFTPLFFMPTYAVYRGMDETLASYLLAIINGASTFGRIIPGVLADKYGPFNILSIAGLTNGIVILCMNKAETTAALVVYSVVFGFTSGMIISGGAAAFATCPKDPRDLGSYMGMGMAVGSIAALIGPPITGALLDTYGGFLQISILSGVMCLVGGFVALSSKVASPQGIMGRV